MRSEWLYTVSLLSAFLQAGTAFSQSYGQAPLPGPAGPPSPENVSYTQRLGVVLPERIQLYDHDGNLVRLIDLLMGKPALLIFHYNRCPKLCNEVIQGVLSGLNEARRSDPSFVAGGPFQVIFISIDPRDPPTSARKNRLLFHKLYDGRPDEQPGIWFLTANHGQGSDLSEADRVIHEITSTVGFRYTLRFRQQDYFYDPDSGQWLTRDGQPLPDQPRNYDYQHSSGILVVTPEGKVAKYLLGLIYSARDLRLSLIEASQGTISQTFSDQIAQYCYVYDSVAGHYRLAMRLLAVVFTPFMLFVGYMAFRTFQNARRESAPLHERHITSTAELGDSRINRI